MARSDLYLHDPTANKWLPATKADFGGSGSSGNTAGAATAANQALAIASLQSLDTDNATEAEQTAIKNAIAALETNLLAENATEAKQDLLLAKADEIKNLLTPIVWGVPVANTVGNGNKEILPASSTRKGLILCNPSKTEYLYVNIGAIASATAVIYIVKPGQTLILKEEANLSINAIVPDLATGAIAITYRVGT